MSNSLTYCCPSLASIQSSTCVCDSTPASNGSKALIATDPNTGFWTCVAYNNCTTANNASV